MRRIKRGLLALGELGLVSVGLVCAFGMWAHVIPALTYRRGSGVDPLPVESALLLVFLFGASLSTLHAPPREAKDGRYRAVMSAAESTCMLSFVGMVATALFGIPLTIVLPHFAPELAAVWSSYQFISPAIITLFASGLSMLAVFVLHHARLRGCHPLQRPHLLLTAWDVLRWLITAFLMFKLILVSALLLFAS